MTTQRWFQLAAALMVGALIGFGVARSTSPDVPERRYEVHGFSSGGHPYLYRCDTHTGKTWGVLARSGQLFRLPWKEILETELKGDK